MLPVVGSVEVSDLLEIMGEETSPLQLAIYADYNQLFD
jgi:hypothetical protein